MTKPIHKTYKLVYKIYGVVKSVFKGPADTHTGDE
jgi:hypothetical protein